MTNALKLFVFVILGCLAFQNYPSQAADDEVQRKADVADNKMYAAEEKRLAKIESPIPSIAQGHEEVYRRFINGALIYKPPDPKSDVGMVTLLIRDLSNPLEGTFDLSQCGDAEKYLSISTGYRKEKKPENANKAEIWICPRFLIERELTTTAAHFRSIMGNWKQEAFVGLFWTWGGWDSLSYYAYLTTQSMDEMSNGNLNEKYDNRRFHMPPWDSHTFNARGTSFHISF